MGTRTGDAMPAEKRIRRFCSQLEGEQVLFERTAFGTAYLVDLSGHRLSRLETNLLAVVSDGILDAQKSATIISWLEEKNIGVDALVFIVTRDSDELGAAANSLDEKGFRTVVLPESLVLEIASREPHEARRRFTQHLASRLPPKDLAPWDPTLPAVGGSFYGRDRELRSLTSNATQNYLVTGARRIGKTSLMRQAVRELQRLDNTREFAYYVNCQGVKNAVDFCYRLGAETVKDGEAADPSEASVHSFLRELKRKSGGRMLQIFLDEADDFVAWDAARDWKWMKTLMWAFENGLARFVFGGFRQARRLLSEVSSPFSGKCHTMRLASMGQHVARRVVEEPLSDLGFEQSTEFVEAVVQKTGGLPHIIHFYCWWCMQNKEWPVAAKKKLSAKLLDDAESSDDFVDLVVLPAMNLLESSLEKAVYFVVLSFDRAASPRTKIVHEIQKLCDHLDPWTIEEALENLKVSGLIEKAEGGFRAAAPVIGKELTVGYASPLEAAGTFFKDGTDQ